LKNCKNKTRSIRPVFKLSWSISKNKLIFTKKS